MLPRRALIGSLVLALVAGCTSSGGAGAQPDGPDVLAKASAGMKSVTSTHFTIKVDGELPDVTVKDAEGDLNAAGESQGRAKVEQFGQLIEVDYVLVGQDLYFKGPTGGFTKLPAALAGQVYDPTAILDPDKGVPACWPTRATPRRCRTTTVWRWSRRPCRVTWSPGWCRASTPTSPRGSR